jgi:hypothetical protein
MDELAVDAALMRLRFLRKQTPIVAMGALSGNGREES